jgi:hypothetical protein
MASMLVDRGHLRAMRLLPFAAAILTLNRHGAAVVQDLERVLLVVVLGGL